MGDESGVEVVELPGGGNQHPAHQPFDEDMRRTFRALETDALRIDQYGYKCNEIEAFARVIRRSLADNTSHLEGLA